MKIYDETIRYRGFQVRVTGVTGCPVPTAYVWEITEEGNRWSKCSGTQALVAACLTEGKRQVDEYLAHRSHIVDL